MEDGGLPPDPDDVDFMDASPDQRRRSGLCKEPQDQSSGGGAVSATDTRGADASMGDVDAADDKYDKSKWLPDDKLYASELPNSVERLFLAILPIFFAQAGLVCIGYGVLRRASHGARARHPLRRLYPHTLAPWGRVLRHRSLRCPVN